MEKENLEEIVANHGRWLQGDGGKRADLSGANLYRTNLYETDLRGADLRGANLYNANLRKTDLHGANLHSADLYGADLYGANLRGANLRHVDLYSANLRKADLYGASLCKADLRGTNLEGANLVKADLWGADLPTGMYQVVGAGSCNRCTTYDTINDQIVCGCWDDGKGNHLDSFIDRIESIYGSNGEYPNSVHYTEYMAAINFFRAMKQLKENQDKQRNEGFRQKGAIL